MVEKQNADIDIKGSFGNTPLYYASDLYDTNTIKYLISKRAKIEACNNGRTLLHSACLNGRIHTAEYLIFEGANLNAKDKGGDYVIHTATKGDLLTIILDIIDKQNIDINIKRYCENTPLHYACRNSDFRIALYLISKGANAKDKYDRTPLHSASYYKLLIWSNIYFPKEQTKMP